MSQMEPLRLWYAMGMLEVTDPGPLINPPSNIRTLMRYRAALDKKSPDNKILDRRIESTWCYLGALAWCLKHNPFVLDGTGLVWTRDKSETILSDKGVYLEYFITLLSLTGLYASKAKLDRDQNLRISAAPSLELCAQACTYAALHVQKYGENLQDSAFHNVSPGELTERARLLELCALQERIDMNRPNGALYLMGELHAFSLTAQHTAMRIFAICMVTDWRMALVHKLGSVDPLLVNKDKKVYEQAVRAQHYLLSIGRQFELKYKKENSMKKLVQTVLVDQVTKVKDEAKQTLTALKVQRAKYLMTTGQVSANLDPGQDDPIEHDLFHILDPSPLQSSDHKQGSGFVTLLQVHMDTFASGDAHSIQIRTKTPEVPILGLDEYAYTKVPLTLRKAVLWGMMVERRHHLEEQKVLLPRTDIDDELNMIVTTLNKTSLV